MGAIGAAYSAYQLIDNWGENTPAGGAVQGASAGAYIGSCICPGLGTVVGGVIGRAVGGLIGCIKKSGKSKEQRARDAVRKHLVELGVTDKKYNLTLANGEKYNIGVDGRNKLTSLDGSRRPVYNVDSSNPLTHEVIGWAQPLAALLTGGDQKLKNDLTGYFVNAALSIASDHKDALKNVQAFFCSMKITPGQALEQLKALTAAGKIRETDFEAYAHGLKCLMAGVLSDGTSPASAAEQSTIRAAA